MHRLVIAACLLLAACSSSSATQGAPASGDTNSAVCSQAKSLIRGQVSRTFADWNPKSDLFDRRAMGELRYEGTKMLELSGRASGDVAAALHEEGRDLVDLSVAMDSRDAARVGSVADSANGAVAEVRAACGF